jgi:hypothetical protein
MATYSGFLSVTGVIDFAAMTVGRAVYVSVRDAGGAEIIPPPVPGSSPDLPIFVQSLDGQMNRVRLEGGNVGRIDTPVAIAGTVPVTLPVSQVAQMATPLLPLDYLSRILVAPPVADPFVAPEVNLVQVDGVVVDRPETSSTEARTAITVSTAAVLVAGANSSRKSLIIANTSSGTLYLGNTSAVSTSGTTMGTPIGSLGGVYSDSGYGTCTGEVWGIYSAAASSPNVSVSDRS